MQRSCTLHRIYASVDWVDFFWCFYVEEQGGKQRCNCSGTSGVNCRGTILIQKARDLCDPFLLVQAFPAYRPPDQQRAKDKDLIYIFFNRAQ